MDFDFENSNTFDIADLFGGDVGSSGVDLSALGTDLQELDLSNLFSGDGGGIDLSGLDMGPEAFDISSLLGSSGAQGDYGGSLGAELAAALQDTGNASSLFSGDGGLDVQDIGSLLANPEAYDLADILKDQGNTESPLKSLASTDKDTTGGKGLKATGRGQLSMVNPETGATGITGEGFKSIEDLLGSGTKEEIARYTPGSMDTSLRSGLETEGGQGFNADSTRGMSLENMGGGQGLSKYVPAEYEKGSTTPYRGTGGTLSETGFLSQSSAANPLGSKYSIGDPKSFINNPTITGQQSVVSPGRTIIDNKDGTYKVVTNTVDGTKTITTTKDGVDKIIRETKTIDNTKKTDDTKKTDPGAKANAADKKDNNMLMMMLALMAMMNKGGGGSKGSGSVIPSLQANRSQLPYGPAAGTQAARPGAGGVNYFSPTSYTPKAAGGGMMYGGGGISDLGGYSDGGRLLKGPGDGVSDSIPATIGKRQPARLATGEFVVPARVVSELGNGSTDAGAKRLYDMMDRVQKARRQTKNVAADTKARKYLPA